MATWPFVELATLLDWYNHETNSTFRYFLEIICDMHNRESTYRDLYDGCLNTVTEKWAAFIVKYPSLNYIPCRTKYSRSGFLFDTLNDKAMGSNLTTEQLLKEIWSDE